MKQSSHPPANATVDLGKVSARIVEASAVSFLHSLPAASVDLLVTSPPYFIGKEYDSSTSPTDFETALAQLVPSIERVLKPNANLCLQVGNHVHSDFLIPLDFVVMKVMQLHKTFQLRNRIIWTFSHGVHARRRFSGRHGTILWYSRGENYFFDLDAVRIPQKHPEKRHYKGPQKGEYSGNPLGKNPGDFWELGSDWAIPNVKANHVEKTSHPCQFPIALVRRLILSLCPEGGTVLDSFVGSGSSAVAALMENRNFLGCDLAANYVSIAENRLRALAKGNLKFRLDSPVRSPPRSTAVTTAPRHFKSHMRG